MKIFLSSQMLVVLSLFMLGGCAAMPSLVSQEIHARPISLSFPKQMKDLAGSWEYKDVAGQGVITLNTEGGGTYEWEEGWFETLSLENGVWIGVWSQEGNDREGGFRLTFSDDASVAQGEWWYTRIGNDNDPLQSGGTFRMTRSSAVQIAQ